MGRKCNIKNSRQPGMEIHICNPITKRLRQEDYQDCEASLSCRVR